LLLFLTNGCAKNEVRGIGDSETLIKLSKDSEALVAKVLPSVVRIDVAYGREVVSDQLEDFFGTIPEQAQIGSGVIIDRNGSILTNYHVVRGSKSIQVSLTDGRQLKAELLGSDALTDIAVLQVKADKLSVATWGKSNKVAAGSLVWSFGSPFGMNNSASLGIISSAGRSLYADNPFHDFIQTDASINPGSSGGPLIDVNGELIGINTAIAGEQFSGVGFASPIDLVRQVYSQIVEHGHVDRVWLGIELAAVSQDEAVMAGRKNTFGATVRSFQGESTAAQKQGLQRGDIILEIGGKRVTGPTQALRQIAGSELGKPIVMRILRSQKEFTLEITP
jgi:S1-C subfamily serine protease